MDKIQIFSTLSSLLAGWLVALVSGFFLFMLVMVLLGKFDVEVQYGDWMFFGIVGAAGLLALSMAILVYKKLKLWISRQSMALVLSICVVLVLLSLLIRPRFFEFFIR